MIRDLARTALVGGTVTGLTATLGPVIIALGSRDEEAPDGVIRLWARGILRSADVRDEVVGLENLPQQTCVYVCNHLSHFDVLVLLTRLPRHVRFIAKAELYDIPIFGRAMVAAGNVTVDRSGSDRDRRAMMGAVERVRTRTNILFFAEGTRSEDGLLGRFKKGAAALALEASVPMVPMAIAGTKDILTKGSIQVHGGRRVTLCIGEAIRTEGMKPTQRDELTQRARAAVEALYAEARALAARA